MTEIPLLSAVVFCRNENEIIAGCLDSVVASDYPKDRMELLVVDGMSEDGTREIIAKYAQEYSFIRMFDNPQRVATTAMNIGVRNAKGEVIAFLGAHTLYPSDYLSKCVYSLKQHNVDNVGGVMRTLPRTDTMVGKAIAIAMSHPFGTGNALFRVGAKAPQLVDTVFGGCYRREVFERIGMFNEQLARSQDMDLNIRLRKAGGKILLDPSIECYYYVRSDLRDFAAHVFDDGKWDMYPLKVGGPLFYPRHLIPLAFVSALTGSLLLAPFLPFFLFVFFGIVGLYATVSLFFSIQVAVRERELRYLFWMLAVFGVRHFAHGLGALYGLLLVLTSGGFWKLVWQRFRLANRYPS